MIIVRRATVDDLTGMRAVLAITWRDTYGAFVPIDAIERATAVWHAPEALAAELARSTTFTSVAVDAHGVVGVVTAHRRPDAVEIARLYVHPAAQRRGIGGRLLASAISAFPDVPRARLEVEAQNPKGRAFYGQAGFVAVAERTVEVFEMSLRVIVMERSLGRGDEAPLDTVRRP
jgi:ribosomal protein S18 acetylase RimI-like enzyme